MDKIKTAVMVSGGGTNLQAIIDAVAAEKIKSASIEVVISSNASAYALQRAQNAGIKTAVVEKNNATAPKISSAEFSASLQAAISSLSCWRDL